ncbi:MerR family DNA-binding transcriptional regulator [Spirillospora sp. NPDC050679]
MTLPPPQISRWGWIAILYCDSSRGPWSEPGFASAVAGVSTATLRRWANSGLISVIQQSPGNHRRYFLPELDFLYRLGRQQRLNTRMLTAHINEVLSAGIEKRS